MILVATNKRDITSDFIVLELRRRGLSFLRLNTEDIGQCRVVLPSGDPSQMQLESPSGLIHISQVKAAYYRRPGVPTFEEADNRVTKYLEAEWSAILRSLWNALEGRWLNSPFAILRAEDKPRQIALAKQAGFCVPETLISNCFKSAKQFISGGSSIAKPLRHALIDDGESGKVIFTNRTSLVANEDAEALDRSPVILQREIRKRFDVRVVVIDDHAFATNIHSQSNTETETDWRRGVRTDLVHETTSLPLDIQTKCLSIVKSLGLRFAAIDLVQDMAGNYWFLEANPNGQWAWIEQRTGAPISATIVDGLAK